MENQTNETCFSHFCNISAANRASHDGVILKIVEATLYGLIAMVSIIGNSFLILAYRRNITGHMRSVYNLLVASIGAGDLLLAVWSIPERMTRVLMDDAWIIEGITGR